MVFPLQLSGHFFFAVTFLAMSLFSRSKAFLPSLVAAPSRHSTVVRHFSPVQIAPPEEVLRVFQKPNTVILDVRSQPEIDAQGFLHTNDKNLWLQVNCTPMECPSLPGAASTMFPDKQMIIHCASGMRAGKAKEILGEMGYKDVVNAGGYQELGYLQDAADGVNKR